MGKDDNNFVSNILTIFISIATFLFLIMKIFFKEDSFTHNSDASFQVLYVVASAIILAILINFNTVHSYFEDQLSRIKLLNEITFEYRKGFFEILDKGGKEVIYTEDCLIKKIRKNFIYEGTIDCGGKINKNIQTFNCASSLNNKKNEITIIYGRKRKREEHSIIDPRQLQYGYCIKMHNSFTGNKEYWETHCNHYTKLYDLKMSFPKKHPPTYVDIFQIKTDKKTNKDKILPMPIDPLIIEKKNKILVKIKLLHLEKDSKFRIEWEW